MQIFLKYNSVKNKTGGLLSQLPPVSLVKCMPKKRCPMAVWSNLTNKTSKRYQHSGRKHKPLF